MGENKYLAVAVDEPAGDDAAEPAPARGVGGRGETHEHRVLHDPRGTGARHLGATASALALRHALLLCAFLGLPLLDVRCERVEAFPDDERAERESDEYDGPRPLLARE